MSGKIREKSGNFEVNDKWQPCVRSKHRLLNELVERSGP